MGWYNPISVLAHSYPNEDTVFLPYHFMETIKMLS